MAIATIGKIHPRPAGQQVGAKRSPEHVVVPQNGKQGAQRCRSQPECHRDECAYQSHDGKQPHDYAGDDGGGDPSYDREFSGPLPEECELQLIAGEEKDEPQADVGQQLDAFWLGQMHNLWADDYASDDEHHYLRDAKPWN